MLSLISDDDVHDDVVRGLRRRESTLDMVRAVEVGLTHTPDPLILTWAAEHQRILITGDLNTMVGMGQGAVVTSHARRHRPGGEYRCRPRD